MNSMYTLMSKLTELSETKSSDSTGTKGRSITHKGGVKTVDDKGVKHQGKYGNEYQGDDEDEKKNKAKKPEGEKRGRGRPVKPENQAAKDKPDFTAFGAAKDVKLKPWDKAKTIKHSLKDWIENLDSALNEASPGQQLQVKPLPGASQITDPTGNQVGVATDPATAALVTKASNDGKLTLGNEMDEAQNHMGENEIHSYFAWRVACRKAGGKNFTGDRDIDQCLDPSGKGVGEWDGVCGSVYGNAHTKAGKTVKGTTEQYDPNANVNNMGPADAGTHNKEKEAFNRHQEARNKRITGSTPWKYDKDEVQESGREDWDNNMPGYRGDYGGAKNWGRREREDDEGYARTRKADNAWNNSPERKAALAKAVAAKVKPVAGPGMNEAKKNKPDFLDKDKDGNKKEPFKKATKDATKNPADSKADSRKARFDAKDVAKNSVKESQLNELSKDTLKSYSKKSQRDRDNIDDTPAYGTAEKNAKTKLLKKRDTGMEKAKAKMAESKMSEMDLDLKDKKCSEADFKKQYGKSKADMRASLTKKPMEKKPMSKIKESILREGRDTMQHIINAHKNEVKRFVNGDDLAQDLYDALYDYYCDQGEMPYGTMKARDGDPYEWVTQRFDTDVQDYDLPGGHPDGDLMGMDEGQFTQHYMDANKPSSVRQQAEIARTPRTQTPWSQDPIAAATDRVYDKVSDVFGKKPIADNIQFESWQQEFDALLNEGLNITSNSDLGDGPDSITIAATDTDAQELIDIVKSAGLGMFAGTGEEKTDGVGFGGDAIDMQRNGEEIDVSASEPEVIDDQDGMMDLIKRMTGSTSGSQEEEEVTDESRDADYGAQEGGPEWERNKDQSSDDDNAYEQGEQAELDTEEDDEEDDEKSEQRTDEAFANDADKTFIADIEFMTKGLSGGLNGKKKTQSVGAPVTIASTPLKEATDLLMDFRKLAGF